MINKLKAHLILILISFSLIACNQTATDPKLVADQYWQYLQDGNLMEAEKLATINSHQNVAEHISRTSTVSQLENDEAKTIVSTTITTINPDNNFSFTQTFDTVLVLEQGQWKVDATQSPIPPAPTAKEQELKQLAEELSDSMQENIDSIDETMTEGMQLLNEALREGSKEMGDSLLKLMNDLNSSMQESIDKMKQRREQQLLEKQQAEPDPNQGEGML